MVNEESDPSSYEIISSINEGNFDIINVIIIITMKLRVYLKICFN